MRLSGKTIIAALLALGCAGPLFAATELRAHVRAPDGAGLGGFTVAAVEFGLYGPSTHSRTGVTDAAGDALLSLDEGRDYTVYFSSHGFSPTLAEQFLGRKRDRHNSVRAAGGVHYSTFTAFPAPAPAARIRLDFYGAAPGALLTGDLRDLRTGLSGGPALVRADASGSGSLLLDNVSFAGPGTYNISLYDPRLNRGAGRAVTEAINGALPPAGGAPTLGYAGAKSLDLAIAAPAPRPAAEASGPEIPAPPAHPVESAVKAAVTGSLPARPASGSLKVCVVARSGLPLSGALVRLSPGSKAAHAGEDGCATLAGLAAGSYLVEAQTQLSGTPGTGALPAAVSGAGRSSFTYVLASGQSRSGLVRGTARFPKPADLKARPLKILLYPQCADGLPCAAGDAVAITGEGASEYTYELAVASGSSYYLYAAADGWGRVRRGGYGDMVSLVSTGTAVVDLFFEPAGTVLGRVYKPDGAPFLPASGQLVWVDANNGRDWAGVQLGEDGSFRITGALAGLNSLSINPGFGGSAPFRYALPVPAPAVRVLAGGTVKRDLRLLSADYVGIALDPALAPDPAVTANGDQDLVLGFKAAALPAGTALAGDAALDILSGGGTARLSRYCGPTAPGEDGPCGPGWPGGFGALPLPSPGLYDLYLLRASEFGDLASEPAPGAPYPHFSLLTSSLGVLVGGGLAAAQVRPAYSVATSSGVLVDMNPPPGLAGRGSAALAGKVKAAGFLTRRDYEALGGDFQAFKRRLPVVSLYGADGALQAAGLVLPAMDFLARKEINGEFSAAFRAGYERFKALLDGAPCFVYEIRGLAPGACFEAVLSAPNYAPYRARACVGPAGSVTSLDMDPDAASGR